jgi:hypothetical protein
MKQSLSHLVGLLGYKIQLSQGFHQYKNILLYSSVISATSYWVVNKFMFLCHHALYPRKGLCNCSRTHALKAHNTISPLAHILQYRHLLLVSGTVHKASHLKVHVLLMLPLHAYEYYWLTPEDGSNRLSRNVGSKIPILSCVISQKRADV